MDAITIRMQSMTNISSLEASPIDTLEREAAIDHLYHVRDNIYLRSCTRLCSLLRRIAISGIGGPHALMIRKGLNAATAHQEIRCKYIDSLLHQDVDKIPVEDIKLVMQAALRENERVRRMAEEIQEMLHHSKKDRKSGKRIPVLEISGKVVHRWSMARCEDDQTPLEKITTMVVREELAKKMKESGV
jgi:hypothetical protein